MILDQKNVWALERFLFHATRFRLVEARAAAEPIPAEQGEFLYLLAPAQCPPC